MASAIPRRAERARLRDEPIGVVPRTGAAEVPRAETLAVVEYDATRALAGLAGLGSMVFLPGALLIWVASDVLGGLATRLGAMLN